jgi:gliding motility-associated-like protein
MIMKFLSLIVFLAITCFGWTQQNIAFAPGSNGQTFNTCFGFIIDSGGQGGSGYSNNENVTITLCPDTPGEIISVVFNTFSLSTVDDNPLPNVTNLDYMDVYDGASTSAPTLGTYSGNQLQGVVINATALNPSGCITLRFRSNSSGTGMFTASVTCETPCNVPTAAGEIVGGVTPDSILVCIGEEVQFADDGSYAAFGFTIADYNWDFMDGSSANGPNVSHSFDQPGQYRVQLFVTDDNGCSNTNLIDLEVFVGTVPDFTGFPGDTTLCLGESISFEADPESYEVLWDGFPGSQWIEDGCLPDTLLGVSQDIQIMQTGFSAGETIDSPTDLQSICLDLEHSFMGDIVIIVECPNGQNVILHQQGGGGTQIGIPVQADNVDCSDPTTQGVPFNYCFTPTATETWVEWVNNSGWGGTVPAGDYEPVQPLSNLIGCPLNGVWTLTVIDNWAADDGTLFGFELNLDPALYPPITVFEPQIGWGADSSWWDMPAPYVTSVSPYADTINITPTAPGTYTYNYHVIDHFGCQHDTSVTLTVNDNLLPDAGPDIVVCDGNPVQLNGTVSGLGGGSPCTYTLDLQDEFFDGWGANSVTVTINGVASTYSVGGGVGFQSIPLSIPHGATVSVVFYDNNDFTSFDCSYTLTDPSGNVIISNGGNFTPPDTTPDNFTADCFNGYVFNWSTGIGTFNDPNIPGPIGTFAGQGVVTLTVYPAGHPLCATTDQLNVSISASAYPGADSSLTVCSQGAAVDLYPLLGPGASPNGTWTGPTGAAATMPYNPPTMNPGTYTYAVDSNGCVSSAEVVVTEIETSVSVAVTNVSCNGANNGSIVATVTNANSYSLNGGPAQAFAGNSFSITNLAPGSYVLDVTGSNGCADQKNFTITEPAPLQITSISPDISICPGATTQLSATGTGGSSPYTFTWTQGATVLGTGVPFSVTPTATTQYCVVLTEACGSTPDTACMIVSNPDPIVPIFTPDVTSGCFPVPVNFTNNSTGGTVAQMVVDYGDGQTETLFGMAGSSHVYQDPGVYTVTLTVTSDVGCVYTATYTNLITVFNKPNAYFDILPNPVSMFHPDVQLLDGSSSDVVAWDWVVDGGTPATSTLQDIEAHFPDGIAANYDVTLYVENADGCVDSVTRIVQVISEVLLYAPNTFTPDDDEFNQVWYVYISGIDMTRFDLRIYNRWGEVVWENHDPNAGWDGTYEGKIVQDGIYTWTLETKDVSNDKTMTFNGFVQVLR